MAKGDLAKQEVVSRIVDAFGVDFVGSQNKKYYVWSTENGQAIQVCISLTIPKEPLVNDNQELFPSIPGGGKIDFEDMTPAPQVIKPAEITEKEQQLAEDLLRRLGL